VLDLVAELRDGGAAIVSVFHDLDAVRRLADRVLLISDGQVRADGACDEVLEVLGASGGRAQTGHSLSPAGSR
jgi:ABC-type hemin transport system ATPase subunit